MPESWLAEQCLPLCLQTLNLLFCTMMFGSGLPLLYPIAALGLTASYWAEKWDVLKMSRVPAQTTGALAELAGKPAPSVCGPSSSTPHCTKGGQCVCCALMPKHATSTKRQSQTC